MVDIPWKPLDGGSANEARLQAARQVCRIEIKLAGLKRAEQDRDEKRRRASTEQAKTRAMNEYEQVKQQVYREIDTCMYQQGYQR